MSEYLVRQAPGLLRNLFGKKTRKCDVYIRRFSYIPVGIHGGRAATGSAHKIQIFSEFHPLQTCPQYGLSSVGFSKPPGCPVNLNPKIIHLPIVLLI